VDYETLLFLMLLGSFGYLGLREFRKIHIENARLNAQRAKGSIAQQRWQGLFENLPLAIEQTEAMLFEMKSKDPPPTPEQIEPVEKRLKQLNTVAANQWWIEIILRLFGPSADKMVKWFI
jgi:hypothetical protein